MTSNIIQGAFGEVNRKFWDTQVEKISKEPWVQLLARQIFDHLRSNLAWLGVRESSSAPIKVLDYACGPGIVSKALIPYATEIRGIDVSEGMVDKFNADAREAGTSEAQMRAVRGDLLASAEGPLESREFYEFDLAVMSMALHHVDDPKTMIAKLIERVKPGGTVVIIDWIPSGRFPLDGHGNHGHEDSQGEHKQIGHGHHAASHTISFDGFSREQMHDMFLEAGCSNSNYVLAAAPSEVPIDPTGQKQLFFAKGTK